MLPLLSDTFKYFQGQRSPAARACQGRAPGRARAARKRRFRNAALVHGCLNHDVGGVSVVVRLENITLLNGRSREDPIITSMVLVTLLLALLVGAPVVTDATTPTTARKDRALRGGSFTSTPRNVRSAWRERDEPDFRYDGIGFRVGLTLD